MSDDMRYAMSIESVVIRHLNEDAPPEVLVNALIEREETIADILRLAGIQFGLFPEIVAEVLSQVGMGRPISVEQRAMIHANFHALMQRLQDEQGGQS